MNQQQASIEISKRMGWKVKEIGPSYWHIYQPSGATWTEHPIFTTEEIAWEYTPNYFTDEAASRELLLYVKATYWTAFLEALRGLLIDQTGQPVGIADFMLATAEQIAAAARAALGIELDKEAQQS